MNPLKVEFLPDADEEAMNARDMYAARSPAAAKRFAAEVDRAIERIAEAPERWPKHAANTRFFRLRRFPYLVIYRIEQAKITVVAVAHARRKPGYWKRRLL